VDDFKLHIENRKMTSVGKRAEVKAKRDLAEAQNKVDSKKDLEEDETKKGKAETTKRDLVRTLGTNAKKDIAETQGNVDSKKDLEETETVRATAKKDLVKVVGTNAKKDLAEDQDKLDSKKDLEGTETPQTKTNLSGVVYGSDSDNDEDPEGGWELGDLEDEEEEVRRVEESFRDKIGPEVFRGGQEPTLPNTKAAGWLKELTRAKKKPENDLEEIVRAGMAKTTRQAHRRILSWLDGICMKDEEANELGIASFILKKLMEESRRRMWQSSTLTTRIATVQGALANMSLYRSMPAVFLKSDVEWRNALRGAGTLMRSAVPNQARIATLQDIQKAIEMEERTDIKVALEIAWITAGRGGDVLKLRKRDVLSEEGGTRVRFVVGKTASAEPYTVATAPMSERASKFIAKEEKDSTGWLFPGINGTDIMRALRKVCPLLEQRSIRRGALQFLAGQGMSDQELLAYSQHKSITTLRRYLDFGWLSGEGRGRQERARGLAVEPLHSSKGDFSRHPPGRMCKKLSHR
jgi:integrase